MAYNTNHFTYRNAALCAAALGALFAGAPPAVAQNQYLRPTVITRFNPSEPNPGDEVIVNIRSNSQLRTAVIRINGLINALSLTVETPGRMEAEGRFRIPQNARFDPYSVEVDVVDLNGRTARGSSTLYVRSDQNADRPGYQGRPTFAGSGSMGVRVRPDNGQPGDRMSVVINAPRRLRSLPTGTISGMSAPLTFRQGSGNPGQSYVAWFRVPANTQDGTFRVSVTGRERNGNLLQDSDAFRIGDAIASSQNSDRVLHVSVQPDNARPGDRVMLTVHSPEGLRRDPRASIGGVGQNLDFTQSGDRYTAYYRVAEAQRDGRMRIDVDGVDQSGDRRSGFVMLNVDENGRDNSGRDNNGRGNNGRGGNGNGNNGRGNGNGGNDRSDRTSLEADVTPDIIRPGDQARIIVTLDGRIRGDLRGSIRGLDNTPLEFERSETNRNRITARFKVPANARPGTYRVEVQGEDAEDGRTVTTETTFRVQ